jgi:hypothetical protein
MAAQELHARQDRPSPRRYTLHFRNGELMRLQDPLTVAQYCSDARLLLVQLETPADVA